MANRRPAHRKSIPANDSQEQVNTAFLAFILHSLCWKRRIPGQDDVIAVTKETTPPELIPLDPSAQDKLTLRMLYNARLPGSYAIFFTINLM